MLSSVLFLVLFPVVSLFVGAVLSQVIISLQKKYSSFPQSLDFAKLSMLLLLLTPLFMLTPEALGFENSLVDYTIGFCKRGLVALEFVVLVYLFFALVGQLPVLKSRSQVVISFSVIASLILLVWRIQGTGFFEIFPSALQNLGFLVLVPTLCSLIYSLVVIFISLKFLERS